MFNIGGGELLIIILVIIILLVFLNFPKLPTRWGRLSATIRRFNQSFQDEPRFFDDPIEEAARERGKELIRKESNELENNIGS